jgi:hypothetical protein
MNGGLSATRKRYEPYEITKTFLTAFFGVERAMPKPVSDCPLYNWTPQPP